MRVEIQTTKGFVHLSPGVGPVTVDLASLSPAERHALERLVRRARFFDLPSTMPTARGAEERTCRIKIEDGGREHTVHVSYSVPGPKLQKLIDRLVQLEAAALRDRRARSAAGYRTARTFSASITHIPRP
jgi:hypothetical protein